MEIGLDGLERLLDSSVPKAYADYVRRTNAASLGARGFDPKTLCVLNLELRETDREGWTRGRFFLTGDGCGNYYFVPGAAVHLGAEVLLWSHDPPGIEDLRVTLLDFLQSATQENPIVRSVAPGRFCIARTALPGESILRPISPGEWRQAVSRCDGLRYRGYLVGRNPFTGEVTHFEMPGGVALADCGGEEVVLTLCYGRVVGAYSEKLLPIAESLAHALAGKLTKGIDE